ncbi:MAG: guanylate kinase [Dehalococcoidales bacterium]
MKKAAQSQPRPKQPAKPLLIVLSGPSGVGKDAVLSRMKNSDYPLYHVVTLTTRPKRAREKDNIDYRFVSGDEFKSMIEDNKLLEWAKVYDNWYGVPGDDVRQALERGEDVIIKVDIQGAASIKKLIPQAVSIFLTPPSLDELGQRLSKRRTESPEAFELRLKTAEEEMKQQGRFDYSVVSQINEIDQAVEEIKTIISAEKSRATNSEIRL